jgi:hypothetical protein
MSAGVDNRYSASHVDRCQSEDCEQFGKLCKIAAGLRSRCGGDFASAVEPVGLYVCDSSYASFRSNMMPAQAWESTWFRHRTDIVLRKW